MTRPTIEDVLAQTGSAYRKKPGVRGFSAYRVDDPDYTAYNRLEDATYTGSGYYIVGLAGEVWRARSFDAVAESYVLDGAACARFEDGCELDPRMFAGGCRLPVRYRDLPGGAVLAARAPRGCASVELDLGDETVALRCNAPFDRFGRAIEHGGGDLLACPLVPVEETGDAVQGRVWVVSGKRHVAQVARTYVINGAVFALTYERCRA